MLIKLTKQQFNIVVRARTKRFRERTGMTQERMAYALGANLEAYKKYENRGPGILSPHLIFPFCNIARIDADKLLTYELDRGDIDILRQAGHQVGRAG